MNSSKPQLRPLVRRVVLSSTEMKAISNGTGTSRQVVAAPGVGKYINFLRAVLFFKAGTEVITETDDNFIFEINGTAVSEAYDMTGFIDQSADQLGIIYPKATEPIMARTAITNQSLDVATTNNGWGGNASGDAELDIFISYRIIQFGGGVL